MRRLQALTLVLLLAFSGPLLAAQWAFPPLSGRVVDSAQMLGSSTEQQIEAMFQAHEQRSGEQLVVVTLPDLQGRSIEELGVALGRHWGLGQKSRDNGALLIVVRDERKVRIEVGYGLEGRLTDAQASLIINRLLVPAFRQSDFDGGVLAAAQAMVQVLGGDPLEPSAERAAGEAPKGSLISLFGFLLVMVLAVMSGGGRGDSGRAVLLGALLGGISRGAGMGGGGGGGFSGGGGGFGGGGASGGW